MAYPTVESVTVTAFATDATSHLVNMPAAVNAGDLLLCLFACDGNTRQSAPAGWTAISGPTNSPSSSEFGIYAKDAVGDEGGTTVDFQTSGVEKAIAHVWRISGWGGTLADDVDVGTPATGSTNSPDPPSVTAGWGSDTNLWIACFGINDENTANAYPSGYTDNQNTNNSGTGGGGHAGVASCSKNATAASDDPGTFTATAATGWVAQTIAVRPAVAGGVEYTRTVSDGLIMEDPSVRDRSLARDDTALLLDLLQRDSSIQQRSDLMFSDTPAVIEFLLNVLNGIVLVDLVSTETSAVITYDVSSLDGVLFSDHAVRDLLKQIISGLLVSDAAVTDIAINRLDSIQLTDSVVRDLLKQLVIEILVSDSSIVEKSSQIINLISLLDGLALIDTMALDAGVSRGDAILLSELLYRSSDLTGYDFITVRDALIKILEHTQRTNMSLYDSVQTSYFPSVVAVLVYALLTVVDPIGLRFSQGDPIGLRLAHNEPLGISMAYNRVSV